MSRARDVARKELLTNTVPLVGDKAAATLGEHPRRKKDIYNNTPLLVLSAYTPLEVLGGAVSDNKRFNAEIKTAIIKRKEANQKEICADTCKARFTGSF